MTEPGDPDPPFECAGDAVLLSIRLTPKASHDGIDGVESFGGEPVLKVRVRAIPSDGEANAALCKLIAKWIGVPASSVSLAQGGKSRLKRLRIAGDPEMLKSRLLMRLPELG